MLEFAESAVIPATSEKEVDEKRKKSGEMGRRRRGQRTEEYVENKTTNEKLKTKGLKNDDIHMNDNEQECMT